MLGYTVNKAVLDSKAADTVIAVREAFEKVETMASWLVNNPKDGNDDPLVDDFDYTEDEAYALRLYFETMNTVRLNNVNMANVGRKMTGLV